MYIIHMYFCFFCPYESLYVYNYAFYGLRVCGVSAAGDTPQPRKRACQKKLDPLS